MLLRAQDFLVRHWLPVGIFTVLFVSLPEWIGSVWGLFSAEPIFPVMWKRLGEMNMPSLSPYWLTIPLSLCMFGVLIYLKWKEGFHRQVSAKDPETRPNPLAGGSHTKKREPFPIEGYTLMKEAAAELYEAFPEKFILERARQELQMDIRFISNDPIAERLKFAAKLIASKIPLYGEESLTGVFGRIVHMDLMNFNHDLTKLTHALYDESPNGSYVKIAVKSDELSAFFEEEGMQLGHEK